MAPSTAPVQHLRRHDSVTTPSPGTLAQTRARRTATRSTSPRRRVNKLQCVAHDFIDGFDTYTGKPGHAGHCWCAAMALGDVDPANYVAVVILGARAPERGTGKCGARRTARRWPAFTRTTNCAGCTASSCSSSTTSRCIRSGPFFAATTRTDDRQ